MKLAVVSLPIRSSLASRNIVRTSLQLVHTHTFRPLKSLAAEPMFSQANKRYEANQAAPRKTLDKQLFPSSSPSASNGDIREQMKKPVVNGSGFTSASARIPQAQPTPLNNRSVNLRSHSSNRVAPGLASLYGKSDSFKQEPDVIDLTSNEGPSRTGHAVYFAEDDFSDDDNLDLDYEAPSALPALPSAPVQPSAKETMPPPPPSTQSDKIPWSSSPVSHFFPAKPSRQVSVTSSTTEKSLKRESSGDVDGYDSNPPKKVKRRVLPASFSKKEEEPDDNDDFNPAMKTPAPKRFAWDATASAVKEQKKQFKNQKQPEPDTGSRDFTAEEMREITTGSSKQSKNVAVTLSEEQRHVLNLVVNKGQSVFFTGPAGTGKSVLMRSIISELKNKHKKNPERVAVTASTGLAACNIGGITLHSFSGIGLGKEEAPELVKKIRRNPKAKTRWLQTKCLIIDEISMVDGELFDKLSTIGRTIRNNGRPWGGIQLIITGDFFQLPPVPDKDKRDTKFAFDAATWSTSIDHTIGLTQVFRQRDPEFARMLNEIRLGRISDRTVQAFKALSRPLKFNDGLGMAELFSTRNEVESSNEKRLQALSGKATRYDALDTGDPKIRDKLLANMMAPKSIILKKGAQVMLIKNLDETLVNGSLGKVIDFADAKTFEFEGFNFDGDQSMAKAARKLAAFSRDEDAVSSSSMKYPVVQFMATDGSSRTILCQPEDWKVELPNGEVQAKRSQLPLILAWALSIHKAQGQTLERVKVNLGRVFEKGQAYVALSRATCQEGLEVYGFDKQKVMAHPRVVTFYNKLYSAEEANKKRPKEIGDFITNRFGARPPAPVKAPQVIDLDDDEEAMASYGY